MVTITTYAARNPLRNTAASRARKLIAVALRGKTRSANALPRDQRGTAIVEMAFVMPGFCLMVYGIFTYSLILFGRGNAIFAANVAARYASVHSSASVTPSTVASVKAVATPYLYGVLSPANDVTVTYNPSNTIGSTVTVTISVNYSTALPFYKGGTVGVKGTAIQTITR